MRPPLTRTQCYLTCHKDLLTWICQWSKGAGLHLFLHEVSCKVMRKVASIMCIHLQIFKRKILDSKNMQVTKATTYKIQPPCLQHTWDDASQSQTLRFCGGMLLGYSGPRWGSVVPPGISTASSAQSSLRKFAKTRSVSSGPLHRVLAWVWGSYYHSWLVKLSLKVLPIL